MLNGKLVVPNNPILPFIEGDGTGPDIWRASQPVFDAAVEKAYAGTRKITWPPSLSTDPCSATTTKPACSSPTLIGVCVSWTEPGEAANSSKVKLETYVGS